MKCNTNKAVLASIVVAAAAISGCASTPRDADTFGRGVSGEVQSVEWGTIQALRPVAIESGRRLTSDTSAVNHCLFFFNMADTALEESTTT